MMYEVVENGQAAASLEDYIDSVKQRKWVVVGACLLGLGLGYLASTMTSDTFTARGSVVVSPTPAGSEIANRLVAGNLDREVEVLVSDAVATAAAERLGDDENGASLKRTVETQFVPGSDVIQLSVTNGSAERASDVVNAFAGAYVDQRLAAQSDYYSARRSAITAEKSELETLRGQLATTLAELETERRSVQASTTLTAADKTGQYDRIASLRSLAQTEQNAVAARLRVLSASESEVVSSQESALPAAEFLSEALVPVNPNGLGVRVFAGVGAMVGLILGIVVAFIMSRLDRSASSEADVKRAVGANVLGNVPDLGWSRSTGAGSIAMLSQHKTGKMHRVRESYRQLRTSLEFLRRTDQIQAILITSSHPGEGKSVTSANLAVALANSGVLVVLVNADMRRPSLEPLFGSSNDGAGLSTYLSGQVEEIPTIGIESVPNLVLVPAGPTPDNPGEMLASSRFSELMIDMKDQADFVIVDTPPVGSTADAAAAAASVDGVVVVVDAKSASTTELEATRSDLERVGANVIGAIMNRDRTREAGLLNRRNRYAYGETGKG